MKITLSVIAFTEDNWSKFSTLSRPTWILSSHFTLVKSLSLFHLVNTFCHIRLNPVLKDKDVPAFGRGWEHYPFCHKKYVKNSERCEYFLTSIQKIFLLQPVEDNLFSSMSSYIKLSAYKTIFVVSAYLTFFIYSFFLS